MSSEATGKSRRERERDRHRQEILAAAQRVVDARGVEGLTVDEVARQAEFAVGSIYRHFRSKEELISELLTDFAELLFEEMEEIGTEGLAFEAHLDRVVRLVHQHQIESLPFLMALLSSPGPFPMPGTAAGSRLQELGMRYFRALEGVVAQGQEEGVLSAGDPTRHVVALIGLMDGFAKWSLFGAHLLEGDVSSLITQAFLQGARAQGGVR